MAEIVRRQTGASILFGRPSAEEIIRQRFGVYRNFSAAKLETMKPVPEVVDTTGMNLLPNIRLHPTAASAIMNRRS